MNQRTKPVSAFLALAVVFSPTAWSQQKQSSGSTQGANPSVQVGNSAYKNSPEHYYQLKFRVLNISPEGKVVNSRLYSETIASGPKSDRSSSIRTGDGVPVGCATGTPPDCPPSQFVNIGTDIDVQHIEIIGQTLRLSVSANITALSSKPPASPKYPIRRSTKWTSYVTVPVNKPTIIFSSDNSADKGRTELELTAVPIGQ